MGLIGILIALGGLIWLAYRGWSILLLAPAAAAVATAFAGEPLLAHWTLTFMGAAAAFVAQFFPLFLLGSLFGKLMDDSGSVTAIADAMMRRLGPQRAMLAVVLAGALITYGGVSLFVAFFVLAPMASALFRVARIPNRLMPAAIVLGTSTFTMSALPGTPAIQNAIPMPFFGTTPFAAPGLGILASVIMLLFGLWWLARAQRHAQTELAGDTFSVADLHESAGTAARSPVIRERATTASSFDPAEAQRGGRSATVPGTITALMPLIVMVAINMAMSLWLLPNWNADFLDDPAWGGVTLDDIGGVWSVLTALLGAIVCVVALNWRRFPSLRETADAGVNAAALPILSVASLVGFGSVVAAMPAFAAVRDWLLTVEGGPLVSLAISTNVLAALTGSASGGLTIALQALGDTYMAMAVQTGLDPALMHRVAVIGAGTLDSLPHNGAVVTLLAVCGATHRDSYRDIVIVGIVGPILALSAVIALGGWLGSF